MWPPLFSCIKIIDLLLLAPALPPPLNNDQSLKCVLQKFNQFLVIFSLKVKQYVSIWILIFLKKAKAIRQQSNYIKDGVNILDTVMHHEQIRVFHRSKCCFIISYGNIHVNYITLSIRKRVIPITGTKYQFTKLNIVIQILSTQGCHFVLTKPVSTRKVDGHKTKTKNRDIYCLSVTLHLQTNRCCSCWT